MSSRVKVVQRIEDDIEAPKPRNIEVGIFDVRMVRFELDVGIELMRGFFCDLTKSALYPFRHRRTDDSFRFLDVFVSEKKLAVQITQIYSVEIDDVYFTEP